MELSFLIAMLAGGLTGAFSLIIIAAAYLLGIRKYRVMGANSVHRASEKLVHLTYSWSYHMHSATLCLGEGWHFYRPAPALLHISVEGSNRVCDIYCRPAAWKQLESLVIAGNGPRRMNVFLIAAGPPSISFSEVQLLTPRPWQQQLMERLSFKRGERCLSLLVAGPAGLGKSSLVDIIANRLGGPVTAIPSINLSQKGINLPDLIMRVASGSLVVVELCEFDHAISSATGKASKTLDGTSSHADSKPALTALLDYLGTHTDLIVVATMNSLISEFTTKEHLPYIRKGRFNYHFQLNEAGQLQELEPP